MVERCVNRVATDFRFGVVIFVCYIYFKDPHNNDLSHHGYIDYLLQSQNLNLSLLGLVLSCENKGNLPNNFSK